MPFTFTTLADTITAGGEYRFSLNASSITAGTNVRWLITPAGYLPGLSGFSFNGIAAVSAGTSDGTLNFMFDVPEFQTLFAAADPTANRPNDILTDSRSGDRTFRLELFEDHDLSDNVVGGSPVALTEANRGAAIQHATDGTTAVQIVTVTEPESADFTLTGGAISFSATNKTVSVTAITDFVRSPGTAQAAPTEPFAAHTESMVAAGVNHVIVFYDTTDDRWEIDVVPEGELGSLTSVHSFATVTVTDGAENDNPATPDVDETLATAIIERTLAEYGDYTNEGAQVNTIATSGDARYTGGEGQSDDVYTITRYQEGDVTINDAGGNNTIKFDFGVEITGLDTRTEGGGGGTEVLDIGLSSGAVVTVHNYDFDVGGDRYLYQIGNGSKRDYTQFHRLIVTESMASEASPYLVRLNAGLSDSERTAAATAARSATDDGQREFVGGDNNDVIAVGTDEKLNVDGYIGDDIYVLSKYQYGDAIIRDSRGLNLIKLTPGMTITRFKETVVEAMGLETITLLEMELANPEEGLGSTETPVRPTITIDRPLGGFLYQIGDEAVITYQEFKTLIDTHVIGDTGGNITGDSSNEATHGNLTNHYTVPYPGIGLPATKTGEYVAFDGTAWFFYEEAGSGPDGPDSGDTKTVEAVQANFPPGNDAVWITGAINTDTTARGVNGEDVYILDVETFGDGLGEDFTITGGEVSYTAADGITIAAVTAFTPRSGTTGQVFSGTLAAENRPPTIPATMPNQDPTPNIVAGNDYYAYIHWTGTVWDLEIERADPNQTTSEQLASRTNYHILSVVRVGHDDGESTTPLPVSIEPHDLYLETVTIEDADRGYLLIRDTNTGGGQKVVALRSVVDSNNGTRGTIQIDIGTDADGVTGRVEFNRGTESNPNTIDLIAYDDGNGLQAYDPRDNGSMIELGEALGLEMDDLTPVFPDM